MWVLSILDLRKAPTTPDLFLESSTSFSAGNVSTDTSSSDKTKPESPKAKPDDGAILRKASKRISTHKLNKSLSSALGGWPT